MEIVVTIVTGIGILIGIVAGIVQVLDYISKKKTSSNTRMSHNEILPSNPTIQNNLPPRITFIGREQEKIRTMDALNSRSYIIAIDGVGGIGKTALALEIAYACLLDNREVIQKGDDQKLFKCIVWISSKDREISLNTILDTIAITTDSKATTTLPLIEKMEAVRKIISNRRTLLVIDNFETITDLSVYDFLTNTPEPSKVLITSREHKIQSAWSISLKGLPKKDAIALIFDEGKRLGLTALQTLDDHTLDQLYSTTGGLPLAIKWSLGQIKQKGQSISSVLSYLYHAKGNIFDEVFEKSWSLLTNDAKKILMIIPCFYSSVSRQAIEDTSQIQSYLLADALGQLIEMSLVEVNNILDEKSQRFDIHPLTRYFALAKLESQSDLQKEIQTQVVNYYVEFSNRNGGLWNEVGFEELNSDVSNILGIISFALEKGFVAAGSNILRAVCDFLVIYGYWNDVVDLSLKAITANLNVDNHLEAARFVIWPKSWLYRHRGAHHEAEIQIKESLAIFEKIGQDSDIAFAKRNLGRVYQETNRSLEALEMVQDSFTIFNTLNDRHNILLTTANLASILMDLGEINKAWSLCAENMLLARQHGDPMRIAHLLNIMGDIARRKGEHKGAKSYWEESLTLFRTANRLDEIADTLTRIANLRSTPKKEAKEMLREANGIYENLGINIKPNDK